MCWSLVYEEIYEGRHDDLINKKTPEYWGDIQKKIWKGDKKPEKELIHKRKKVFKKHKQNSQTIGTWYAHTASPSSFPKLDKPIIFDNIAISTFTFIKPMTYVSRSIGRLGILSPPKFS